MTTQPYTPISCADYDVYEIAIMQGHLIRLKACFSDDTAEPSEQSIRPVSLQIEEGAEFLYYHPSNIEPESKSVMPVALKKIRLDFIKQANIIK